MKSCDVDKMTLSELYDTFPIIGKMFINKLLPCFFLSGVI